MVWSAFDKIEGNDTEGRESQPKDERGGTVRAQQHLRLGMSAACEAAKQCVRMLTG